MRASAIDRGSLPIKVAGVLGVGFNHRPDFARETLLPVVGQLGDGGLRALQPFGEGLTSMTLDLQDEWAKATDARLSSSFRTRSASTNP